MGTNYYLKTNVCSHCGRGAERKHIGKSSAGWCFTLHVYWEEGIKDLPDWKALFENSGNRIEDEYGHLVGVKDMLSVITDRRYKDRESKPTGYLSWEDFYERNNAVPGPHDLIRHRIGGSFCLGHGDGTWDLVQGEFS